MNQSTDVNVRALAIVTQIVDVTVITHVNEFAQINAVVDMNSRCIAVSNNTKDSWLVYSMTMSVAQNVQNVNMNNAKLAVNVKEMIVVAAILADAIVAGAGVEDFSLFNKCVYPSIVFYRLFQCIEFPFIVLQQQ